MTPPIEFTSSLIIDTSAKAESLVAGLDTKEKNLLLEALQKGDKTKSESAETVEKLPELEKENFRIDSTNWKEITSPNGIKVKVNPEEDIREYLEGSYKGEQLFTQAAVLREVSKAGKTLPVSWTTYRDIINKKYKGSYQDFLKGEKIIFAGWRNPNNEEFDNINGGFNLRCADDSYFNGSRNKWGNNRWDRNGGLSVRCLKD